MKLLVFRNFHRLFCFAPAYFAAWYHMYSGDFWLVFINSLWKHAGTHDINVIVDKEVELSKDTFFWFGWGMILGSHGLRCKMCASNFNMIDGFNSLDKRAYVKNTVISRRNPVGTRATSNEAQKTPAWYRKLRAICASRSTVQRRTCPQGTRHRPWRRRRELKTARDTDNVRFLGVVRSNWRQTSCQQYLPIWF